MSRQEFRFVLISVGVFIYQFWSLIIRQLWSIMHGS